MKMLKYLLDFLIIFLTFDAFIISKNYIIAIPILLFYIAYKLYINKSEIFAFKGNLAFEKKDYDSALLYYGKACSGIKVDQAIMLKYAYILLYCGKVKACSETLNSINIEKLKPNLKNSFIITKSLYLWKSGNLPAAIEKCKEIDAEFKHTLVYETLGYLLILNKKYDEALKYNLEAYEYDSTSLIISDNLAQSYFFNGDMDKSEEIYNKILKDNATKPTFPEPYFYYGLILKNKGDIKSSLEFLNAALSMKEFFLSFLTHDKIKEEIEVLKLSIQNT